MTATTDDLREFELEFGDEQHAAPAAPAVPAYLSSAARRRAADAEVGDGFFRGMYALIVAGLLVSMTTFALVAYDNSVAQTGAETSVSTAP